MGQTRNEQVPKIAIRNQQDAQVKINAKIAVLQEYLKKGAPSGAFVPRSLEQFRVWTDDRLTLSVIGSKSTLYQPWNREARIKILNLLKSLTLEKTSSNQKNKSERLRRENRELRFTLKQLAGEMHKTRQELLTTQRDSERKDQRIADLKEENSKLTAKLTERSGLYSVK